MKKHYFGALALLLCSVISLVSCTDERLYVDDEEIGDGVASISAEALFKNFTPALSRGVEGTALDGIRNLSIFVYNADESELVCTTSFSKDDGDLNVTDNSMTPPDGSYDPTGSASLPTSKADFSFSLPYGRYRIYAVANVGEADKAKLSADKVKTGADLKNVRFDWSGNIKEDGQMFGVFTTDELAKSPASTFDAPEVVIKKSDVKLGAWLRRLASKVTVAYDASRLKENVRIYIKSVQLKDIPLSCVLGENNKPDSYDQLLTTGGIINYTQENHNSTTIDWSNKTSGITLSSGQNKGGSEHRHVDEALFFYENMQGDYEGQAIYNKVQNKDEVGTSINDQEGDPVNDPANANDYKDRIPYGTYIEVEAYYKSDNADKPSEGRIKYRFMLGKNVTYNYNAERNYHYKLTLQFNNWANDPDWHIVYDEPTPSLYTPNQYYISYLYNQDLGFPVRVVTGDDNAKKYTLKAEIIENNWAPFDPATGGVPNGSIGDANSLNGFSWYKAVYDNQIQPGGGYYGKGNDYVGFLSLKKTQSTVIGGNYTEYNKPEVSEFLKNYYEGKGGVSARYQAEYKLNGEGIKNISSSDVDGQYNVTYHTDNSVTVTIPMYTRAKQMVPPTDFSGNNPFDSYMRMARVKFTLYDESGKQVEFKNVDNPDGPMIKERIVPIFQVRRIVNPKAIWRSATNTDPFHVQLMRRANADSQNFETFKSEGPWRAYILQDPTGLVTLKADGQKDVTGAVTMTNGVPVGNMITGSTDTEIDFTYNPTGTGEGRCAIIRVDYHDYTCHHLIFVRQGYDKGVKLGDANWSCYNVYATSRPNGWNSGLPTSNAASVDVMVTESPLSIGSYYKRNNYSGIAERNNSKYGWLTAIGTTELDNFYIENKALKPTTNSWASLKGVAWSTYKVGNTNVNADNDGTWAKEWTAINKNNSKLAVPTYDNYMSLVNDDNVEFGYGVVYGDGATSVATTTAKAYGYTDYENAGTSSKMGMRACIVYDKSNGNQIIFPVSSIGQARRARTVWDFETSSSASNLVGALIYSGVKGVLSGTGNTMRPMTYNLYRMPGAVYWFNVPAKRSDDENVASWDINYNNFVFNHYDEGSLGSGSKVTASSSSDALPIRLIYK